MGWIIVVSVGSLHKTIKFSPYHPENITYYLDELRNRGSSAGTVQLDSLLEQQIVSSRKSLTRLCSPPIFLFNGSQGMKRPRREADLTFSVEAKNESSCALPAHIFSWHTAGQLFLKLCLETDHQREVNFKLCLMCIFFFKCYLGRSLQHGACAPYQKYCIILRSNVGLLRGTGPFISTCE